MVIRYIRISPPIRIIAILIAFKKSLLFTFFLLIFNIFNIKKTGDKTVTMI